MQIPVRFARLSASLAIVLYAFPLTGNGNNRITSSSTILHQVGEAHTEDHVPFATCY